MIEKDFIHKDDAASGLRRDQESRPASMVERVARAISLACSLSVHGGKPEDWAPAIDSDWPDFIPEARAAIAAMREPTEAMMRKGAAWFALVSASQEGAAHDAEDCWVNMIDEALK